MDKGFLLSPRLTDFLHSDDESFFFEQDLRSLSNETAFRERLQELTQSRAARNSAWCEAWTIRSTIKDEIFRSGEAAAHDGSNQPIGLELPEGTISVAPDGTVTRGRGRERLSLTQSMLRNIVGLKNLGLSKNRGADANFYFPPSSSHNFSSTKTAPCPACAYLHDPYGKSTLSELRQCHARCRSCRLVLQILKFYKPGLDGNNKVRIFAPLTKNDTLRIWCQDSTSGESVVPFMIEVFHLPGHLPFSSSIRPAADISGDTSSPEAFAKARYWLQHCVDVHKGCVSNTNVRLPTRLVRIGRYPITHLITA